MTDTTAELLAAYDAQARTAMLRRPPAGVTIDTDGPLVRVVGGHRGFVGYRDLAGLAGADLDALITRTCALYAAHGQAFEWKPHGHDRPADLADRLPPPASSPKTARPCWSGWPRNWRPPRAAARRHGATAHEPRRPRPDRRAEHRRLGRGLAWLADEPRLPAGGRPDDPAIFGAEAGDELVCAAWLVGNPGTEFAGLWGGSTLPAWRGRGIYRALIAARAQLAVDRGFRYLQVDASEDSRPILQRLGLYRRDDHHALRLDATNRCADGTGALDYPGPVTATARSADIATLLEHAAGGGRITPDEALLLYTDAPLHALGEAADTVRRRRYPDNIATYIIDRNINYTNVCLTACKFCAFYRSPNHSEGWTHTDEEILRRCAEAVDLGATQIMLQGGHSPELGIEWYERIFAAIKREQPTLTLHSLGASEVVHIGKVSQLPHAEVIARLHAAGLDSFAGAGAEILVKRPRTAIAPLKEDGETWLSVMEEAHRHGRGIDRDLHDGYRRDQRRAHRAPADDPRRAGPYRRVPLVHPVDVPGRRTTTSRAGRRPRRWSTCGWSRWPACSSTTSTTCRARG